MDYETILLLVFTSALSMATGLLLQKYVIRQPSSDVYDERDTALLLSKMRETHSREYNHRYFPSESVDSDNGLLKGSGEDWAQNIQQYFRQEKIGAMGRLSAGISHDLNNVLSIIQGFAKMGPNKEDPVAFFNKIYSTSERGVTLAKKLQMFSQKRIAEKRVYDLFQVLENEKAELCEKLPDNITLKATIQEGEYPVECADDSVLTILSALTQNSLDSMPKGGLIYLSIDTTEHVLPARLYDKELDMDPYQLYYLFSFRDTGSGIEPEYLSKIMDPYFTVNRPSTNAGLGLSIVYGLVREMCGAIDIRSIPGHGTEVMIYFPASQKPVSRSVAGDVINPASIRFDGVTALVVDDEPDITEMLSELLSKQGANVITASNGNEALMVQDESIEPIDVLLTDILMPEMNGVELGAMFGSLNPDADVIYMSGYPAGQSLIDLNLPEEATFLAKPVDHDALLRLLFFSLTGGKKENSSIHAEQAKWQDNALIGQRQ